LTTKRRNSPRARKSPNAGKNPRSKARRGRSSFAGNLVALILVLIVTAWFIYPPASDYLAKRGEKSELEAELQSLQAENARLKSELARSGDDRFLEERAREQGMVNPGEEAMQVVPDEKGDKVEEKDPPRKEKSWWDGVVEFFRNLF